MGPLHFLVPTYKCVCVCACAHGCPCYMTLSKHPCFFVSRKEGQHNQGLWGVVGHLAGCFAKQQVHLMGLLAPGIDFDLGP